MGGHSNKRSGNHKMLWSREKIPPYIVGGIAIWTGNHKMLWSREKIPLYIDIGIVERFIYLMRALYVVVERKDTTRCCGSPKGRYTICCGGNRDTTRCSNYI